MATKDPVLSVRLPKDLEDRLTRAAETLDLSKNDIARHAIRAAVAAIEADGYRITLPLEMAVKKDPVQSAPGSSGSSLTHERGSFAASAGKASRRNVKPGSESTHSGKR
jgi:hypothetical protein